MDAPSREGGWSASAAAVMSVEDDAKYEVLRKDRSCAGCTISKVEHRAITIPQLKLVFKYIQENCTQEMWTDTNPESRSRALDPDEVNLYALTHYLIKPATKMRQCSYIEFVATVDQPPTWFVSHWGGSPSRTSPLA